MFLWLSRQSKISLQRIPVIAGNGGEKRDDDGNTITKEKCGYLKVEEGTGELNKEDLNN
jgi:ubiquinol-cytochrome c reductase cytochrome b subunit/ubiquinol-cytochrome c reductase cytochrome c1 subunit